MSERAFQAACSSRTARQGTAEGTKQRVSIVHHPDVRRMLMLMKSKIRAMRALAVVVGVSLTPRA